MANWNDFLSDIIYNPPGAWVEKPKSLSKEIETIKLPESQIAYNKEASSIYRYNQELERDKPALDKDFGEKAYAFNNLPETIRDSLTGKTLDTLTTGDIYSMKKAWVDLAQFFIVWDYSKDTMKTLDDFTINFGWNGEANDQVWLADIIDIYKFDKVLVNGVEWERKAYPRPGYYDKSGKYLAIFDNYEVEIRSEKAMKDTSDFDASFEKRYTRFLNADITKKLSEDIWYDTVKTELWINYSDDMISRIKSQIADYNSKNWNVIKVEETIIWWLSLESSDWTLYKHLSEIGLISPVWYEFYKRKIPLIVDKYPNISEENLIKLIKHENKWWDPLKWAPGTTAYGLWQMIDDTWKIYGKWLDRNSWEDQLEATCRYLEAIMKNKSCSIELAMAYYNTWEGIMNISRETLDKFMNNNPSIKSKMDWNPEINENYFIAAVAYYNNISFEDAQKIV